MLRLSGGQVESLFDLGVAGRGARSCRRIWRRWIGCWPIRRCWRRSRRAWDAAARGVRAPDDRRWIAFVRLMVVKARSGWGYETLVREVSDSLHLRRFCRIALIERVPDESTVRKLVRRLGRRGRSRRSARAVIAEATSRRAARFVVRAARIDSTVVEADIRYPTDLGLAQDAARMLAREAAKAARAGRRRGAAGRDRSRAVGGRLRRAQPHDRGAHRARASRLALRLTGEAGELRRRVGPRGAPRSPPGCAQRARGRGAQAKLRAADRLERLADRAEKVCAQIGQRARRARRSPTGWSRSATPTRARSARASSRSRPSSATSCSSPSCARTPAAAPAA